MLAYALGALLTRRMSATETGSSMAFHTTAFYAVASGIFGLALGDGALAGAAHPSAAFLLRAWVLPGLVDLGLMAFLGLIAAFGFYALTQAYRVSPPTIVAPFEFTALVWAVLWGFVFWGEIPDIFVVTGIVIVVASGLYVIHRETVRGRRATAVRGVRPRI